MTVDDLLIMSHDIYTNMGTNNPSEWNTLEDHIAGLSYGRVNELLAYLPSWGAIQNPMDFARYSVLRSMLEDAKEFMEAEVK